MNYNYELHTKQFQQAIKHIDNSISQLEKTKEQLLKSESNIRIANNKSQDITIKKLTKNSQHKNPN